MKATVERGELVLRGLLGVTRLPRASIDAWDMVYQQRGRRLLAFHESGRTQFVRLPTLSPASRAELCQTLTALLGRGPNGRLLSDVANLPAGRAAGKWPWWLWWLEALLNLLTLF